MTVGMRIAVGLAVFLAVAGIVLGVTAREWRGTVLLLVCAVGFLYIGLVLRGAVRRASVPATQPTTAVEEPPVEEPLVEEPHVGPTIWPFVLSLAAVLLVVGVVGVHWILIPAIILFGGAAAGWFVDIERQWHPPELRARDARTSTAGPSTLERQEQPDEHDGE